MKKNFPDYLIAIIFFILCFVFAYMGYFPFNTSTSLKEIHYMLHDSLHLAFNIPNVKLIQYGMNNYYCSPRYREYFNNKKIEMDNLTTRKNKIDSELNEINFQIKESPAEKAININVYRYDLTDFDINRLKQLYRIRDSLKNQSEQLEQKTDNILDDILSKCKRF